MDAKGPARAHDLVHILAEDVQVHGAGLADAALENSRLNADAEHAGKGVDDLGKSRNESAAWVSYSSMADAPKILEELPRLLFNKAHQQKDRNRLAHSIHDIYYVATLLLLNAYDTALGSVLHHRHELVFIPYAGCGHIPQKNPLDTVVKDDHVQGIIRVLKLGLGADAVILPVNYGN